MNNDQRIILDELSSMSGAIVYWGGVKVKILSPPIVRGQRVFVSLESVPPGSHFDIDKPISEIQNLRNRLTLEVPKINADIEIEIRKRAPDPNKKSPTSASIWKTRGVAVYIVFSKEMSESEIVCKNRFKIARDRNDTSVIYLLIDPSGDKPTKKTKGRLALQIKPNVSDWFFMKDYEVDICEIGNNKTLKLQGV